MLQLDVSQTQWPVGQGFFHSGTVEVEGKSYYYVYDCGTVYGKQALARSIDEYLASIEHGIDILFISHFHWDHISGIKRLLEAKPNKDLAIYIPLLSKPERALVAARNAAILDTVRGDIGPIPAEDWEWYARLIDNPEGFFEHYGKVTTVSPDSNYDRNSDHPQIDFTPSRDQDPEDSSWLTVSRAEGKAILAKSSTSSTPIRVWEWITYVPAMSTNDQDYFMKEFHKTFPSLSLRDVLCTPKERRKLVTLYRTVVNYLLVSRDLNLTSMCLYSGPPAGTDWQVHFNRGLSHPQSPGLPYDPPVAGWLGTGDADFKHGSVAEFEKRFHSWLNQVGTFALPHHGSDYSFHPQLLDIFGGATPTFIVGAEPTHKKYGHPHPLVISSVASHGGHLIVVNGDPQSRWTTSFWLFN